MAVVFKQKVAELEHNFDNTLVYEMQLASISLSISEESGLLFIVVKLWMGYCEFGLKQIIASPDVSPLDKSEQIQSFFRKEFFLLCFYIFNLCLYLYEKPLSHHEGFIDHDLFVFVRDSLTAAPGWKNIHNLIRLNVVEAKQTRFSDEEVKLNMGELEKLCGVSQIPIPFMGTRNLVK